MLTKFIKSTIIIKKLIKSNFCHFNQFLKVKGEENEGKEIIIYDIYASF